MLNVMPPEEPRMNDEKDANRPLRILHIEDSPRDAEIIRERLIAAGFFLQMDLANLVISDRGMPNMTGEQLARKLIAIKPGIPIIICSGFSDEKDVQRGRAMGVRGFLMKPVTIGELAEMVRKVLDEEKWSTT